MMDSVFTSVRWDWFKLARRRMPWILLVILLLLSQLTFWASYFTYQNLRQSGGSVFVPSGPGTRPVSVSCDAVLAGNADKLPPNTNPQVLQGLQAQCRQGQAGLQQQLARQHDAVALPGSIPNALNLSVSVGLILVAILTASHFGTEYTWGTLRPNLVRGVGRLQFVAAKLILLALVAAGALLVVVAVTALSSAVASHLAEPPAVLSASTTWAHTAGVLAKSWVALVAYLAFSSFVTVLTSSTAAGMSIAIGYYIGEPIVVLILNGAFGWFDSVAHYLLGQNISALAGLSTFSQGGASVGSLHAFLVLLAYTVLLCGATLFIFERRDVASATGS